MIQVMIMAGGIGTRFWPLSQPLKPKQFLSLIGNKPLIFETIERIKPLTPDFSRLWILGNNLHHSTLESLPYPIPKNQVLEEPFGKNTAACIAWAAVEVMKKDPDGIMVILPSDHWIAPQAGFISTIEKAVALAKAENTLVTIGITPTFAHTGYGYIQTASTKNESDRSVISFTEKPSFEVATDYLKKGNYYWNSGIFVWKASTILNLFKHHLPAHYEIAQALAKSTVGTPEFDALYGKFEPISIDYGIMEKASSLTHMVPAEFEWSDIGSWSALEAFLQKDGANNASNEPIFALDSNNNIVYSEHGRVILYHVKDMIIVHTKETLLIFPKNKDQSIKKVIDHVEG